MFPLILTVMELLFWLKHVCSVPIATLYAVTTLVATGCRIFDAHLDTIALMTDRQPYKLKLANSGVLWVLHLLLLIGCLLAPSVPRTPLVGIGASQALRLVYQTMYQYSVRKKVGWLLMLGKVILIFSDVLGAYAQFVSLTIVFKE